LKGHKRSLTKLRCYFCEFGFGLGWGGPVEATGPPFYGVNKNRLGGGAARPYSVRNDSCWHRLRRACVWSRAKTHPGRRGDSAPERFGGHSDADVLMHAICDAILGALGEADIGHFFPNTDPRWKGARSRIFLNEAARLAGFRDGKIINVDATVIAEAPKSSRTFMR